MERKWPAIKTIDLTRRISHQTVVDHVNMHVDCAEIYGLIGRNGTGKSTFMKLIRGSVPPSSGTVEILGQQMAPGAFHARASALIEDPSFHPGLSGHDNIMCRAYALGLPKPRQATELALQRAGLTNVSHEKARTYSFGMKRRLGIALALVGNPGLLILDEPFNGLDIESTLKLRQVLMELAGRWNTAVLISSHVPDQRNGLVARYGAMVNGRLTVEKTADEVSRECSGQIIVRSHQAEVALIAIENAYPRANVSFTADGSVQLNADVGTVAVTRTLLQAGIEASDVYICEGNVGEYLANLIASPHHAHPSSTQGGR